MLVYNYMVYYLKAKKTISSSFPEMDTVYHTNKRQWQYISIAFFPRKG